MPSAAIGDSWFLRGSSTPHQPHHQPPQPLTSSACTQRYNEDAIHVVCVYICISACTEGRSSCSMRRLLSLLAQLMKAVPFSPPWGRLQRRHPPTPHPTACTVSLNVQVYRQQNNAEDAEPFTSMQTHWRLQGLSVLLRCIYTAAAIQLTHFLFSECMHARLNTPLPPEVYVHPNAVPCAASGPLFPFKNSKMLLLHQGDSTQQQLGAAPAALYRQGNIRCSKHALSRVGAAAAVAAVAVAVAVAAGVSVYTLTDEGSLGLHRM